MNWIITINGLVIGDEQELREQVAPLVMEDQNLNSIVADILEAAQETQPSEVINQWMEREPGVTAVIEFQPAERSTPQQMEMIQGPLDTQLATVAATGLMQGLEDHLMMLEEGGFLVINNENPPTLEQAGEVTRRLFSLTTAAERLDEFGKWNRGSWLDACEATYGENFSLSQFVEISDKNYNTSITCLNTFRAFRTQRYRLSFTHHKEAYYTNLPHDDDDRSIMHQLLRVSERFQLTCADQRKLFSYARNFGHEEVFESVVWEDAPVTDEDVAEGRITNRADLVDRVTVRDSNHNYIFKYERRRYHFRGALSALPTGATDIVCTDDWREVRQNGTASNIPAWTQPGTPTEV